MIADQAQDFGLLFWQPKLSKKTLPRQWRFIYNWNLNLIPIPKQF